MAPRKSSPTTPTAPSPRGFSPMALWRLVFADRYMRPRSWMERRQLRFRAWVFWFLGVVTVLAVQSAAGKLAGVCPG